MRDRVSSDFDNNIAPLMTDAHQEPTFVAAELEYDLDVLKESWYLDLHEGVSARCAGQGTVQGCKSSSERFHFLIPWIEMKKRGIPKFLRTHPTVVTPLCENCYLLYDSKHRRLRTAWSKKAGLTMRKSPQFMRKRYDVNYDLLIDKLRDKIHTATSFLDDQYLKHALVTTLTVGESHIKPTPYMVTNIDTTQLKQHGTITYTRWTNLKHVDRETPM